MNFATKSPLVQDVKGSKRKVLDIRPLLHGQVFAESISTNSVKPVTKMNVTSKMKRGKIGNN